MLGVWTSGVAGSRMAATTRNASASSPVATIRRDAAAASSLSAPARTLRSSRTSCQTSTPAPTTRTPISPTTCAVRENGSEAAAVHACEPGSTRSTPARAHSGLLPNHRTTGSSRARAAAPRASSHVRAGGPCQSSATQGRAG